MRPDHDPKTEGDERISGSSGQWDYYTLGKVLAVGYMAGLGFREAMRCDEALRQGLNLFEGKVNRIIAEPLGLEYSLPTLDGQ